MHALADNITTAVRAPRAETTPSIAGIDHPDSIRGRNILCFSHDWNGDPLSKTHLMRLLARHNRVLWVNSIGYRAPTASKADISRAFKKVIAATAPLREVEPNLFVLNPLVVPAYGRPWARSLSRKLLRFQVRRAMRRLKFRRAMNWVFNPAAAVVAGHLDEESLIYYCVDEYTAFSGVQSGALADMERTLLDRADLVVVSAEKLLASKSTGNPNTVLVRHGVDFEHFRSALDPKTEIPEDLRRIPGPIIGYFGLLAQDWVDVDLLVHVAERFKHASLVLIGRSTMDLSRLQRLPNVHVMGRRPYASLPAYCKGFDVALIPFPISEVTLNANPLKAREYLSAGLPVVSTDIPEVAVLNACRIGRSHAEFTDQIDAALSDPTSRAKRSETMASEGWDARLRDVTRHLAAVNADLL